MIVVELKGATVFIIILARQHLYQKLASLPKAALVTATSIDHCCFQVAQLRMPMQSHHLVSISGLAESWSGKVDTFLCYCRHEAAVVRAMVVHYYLQRVYYYDSLHVFVW